eukprot:PhM_4_TR12870/c0_g1_i1/m.77287
MQGLDGSENIVVAGGPASRRGGPGPNNTVLHSAAATTARPATSPNMPPAVPLQYYPEAARSSRQGHRPTTSNSSQVLLTPGDITSADADLTIVLLARQYVRFSRSQDCGLAPGLAGYDLPDVTSSGMDLYIEVHRARHRYHHFTNYLAALSFFRSPMALHSEDTAVARKTWDCVRSPLRDYVSWGEVQRLLYTICSTCQTTVARQDYVMALPTPVVIRDPSTKVDDADVSGVGDSSYLPQYKSQPPPNSSNNSSNSNPPTLDGLFRMAFSNALNELTNVTQYARALYPDASVTYGNNSRDFWAGITSSNSNQGRNEETEKIARLGHLVSALFEFTDPQQQKVPPRETTVTPTVSPVRRYDEQQAACCTVSEYRDSASPLTLTASPVPPDLASIDTAALRGEYSVFIPSFDFDAYKQSSGETRAVVHDALRADLISVLKLESSGDDIVLRSVRRCRDKGAVVGVFVSFTASGADIQRRVAATIHKCGGSDCVWHLHQTSYEYNAHMRPVVR